MNIDTHRYAVVCRYGRGCGLFHWEANSKEKAELDLSNFRVHIEIQQKAHLLKQANIYRLSQDCVYTFQCGFGEDFEDIKEVILVDGNIFHAPITGDIGESGNRLGSFQMSLTHAKTRPDLYPWATDL